MISREAAITVVNSYLSALAPIPRLDLIVSEKSIVEFPDGWIFYVTSKQYEETRIPSFIVFYPAIIVDKEQCAIISSDRYGHGVPQMIENYTKSRSR